MTGRSRTWVGQAWRLPAQPLGSQGKEGLEELEIVGRSFRGNGPLAPAAGTRAPLEGRPPGTTGTIAGAKARGACRIGGIAYLVHCGSQARLSAWIQGRQGLVRIPTWALSRLGTGLRDLLLDLPLLLYLLLLLLLLFRLLVFCLLLFRLLYLLLLDRILLWIALVGIALGGKTG